MHGVFLAFLTLLFSVRVAGQALVYFFGVSWLPAMEHWQSGIIPYPSLLVIQIAMLVGMIKISTDICHGAGYFSKPRPSWSYYLVGFSFLYAAAMALRYILTMIFRPEMRWFGQTIPIFFHFVLAGFILILGRYHSK
jgi:hypothetical protein